MLQKGSLTTTRRDFYSHVQQLQLNILFYLGFCVFGWNCILIQQPLDSTLSHYLVREYKGMRMSFGIREGEFNKFQLLFMCLDHSVLLTCTNAMNIIIVH